MSVSDELVHQSRKAFRLLLLFEPKNQSVREDGVKCLLYIKREQGGSVSVLQSLLYIMCEVRGEVYRKSAWNCPKMLGIQQS